MNNSSWTGGVVKHFIFSTAVLLCVGSTARLAWQSDATGSETQTANKLPQMLVRDAASEALGW